MNNDNWKTIVVGDITYYIKSVISHETLSLAYVTVYKGTQGHVVKVI